MLLCRPTGVRYYNGLRPDRLSTATSVARMDINWTLATEAGHKLMYKLGQAENALEYWVLNPVLPNSVYARGNFRNEAARHETSPPAL